MLEGKKPFFHADHVGSLLRPTKLLEARKKWKNGKLTFSALKEVEDSSIQEVVKLQEDVGLKVVTDGEFRRENWWIDFISKINGIEISEPDISSEFKTNGGKGSGYIPKVVKTTSQIHHSNTLLEQDVKFLLKTTKNVGKVTIPSPTRIHFHGGRGSINRKVYPDLDEFWSDVAKFYQEEIANLEGMGCQYIQIDDPVLTYFLDERMRDNLRKLGEDPDILIKKYSNLLNECIRKRSVKTNVAMHLCRGNAVSSWIVSGGYSRLAHEIFSIVDVDSFFLEYDDQRSGDFVPLQHIPPGKRVVLGLITTKHGKLEDSGTIKRRIEKASKYVPLANLALSPQCGFASVDVGNIISLNNQIDKLRMVVDIAEDIWGEV